MSVLIVYVVDEDSSGDSTQGVIIGVTVATSLIVLVIAGIVAGIVIIIWNAHMKVHKYCAIRATTFLSLELSVHITNLLLTYFSRGN